MANMANQVIVTPSLATNAILKPSDPIADGTRQVKGLEFDDFRERDITVKEMVAGMATMGFQASAVADAVRIINDMVGISQLLQSFFHGVWISCSIRKLGGYLAPMSEPRFSWAIPPI